ncbi:AraC family transcriptional regulator [Marinilongibacter aquaticus]|uniref:helix-turn-helix domain-containing protein n=1 Tax=Marinilongibacter aquaticus TaxID=2975157 RepID=UPI0021BD2491|nr:AraC family transcriptional regulator [Marinilongibacter aquaticus]UBM58369.1 AraC family transcriptional regulator [Marinilongibacter aquaticus]
MEEPAFAYQSAKPSGKLSDFVDSFWMLSNPLQQDKALVVLPDGRVDLFFSYSTSEDFHVMVSGIETRANHAQFTAQTHIFAVSFKLPAIEYLFPNGIADLLDDVSLLPENAFGISKTDLRDFKHFQNKIQGKLLAYFDASVLDPRKKRLFEYIYEKQGDCTVKALSAHCAWSARQINRYFNAQFGLSPKAYCNILRFRASFKQIKEGKFFLETAFADQSHFIREIKKYAGASPKKLNKNTNDRFIQFSTLSEK